MAGPAETTAHQLLLQIAMLRQIAGAKKQKAGGGGGGGGGKREHRGKQPEHHWVLSSLRRATIA